MICAGVSDTVRFARSRVGIKLDVHQGVGMTQCVGRLRGCKIPVVDSV